MVKWAKVGAVAGSGVPRRNCRRRVGVQADGQLLRSRQAAPKGFGREAARQELCGAQLRHQSDATCNCIYVARLQLRASSTVRRGFVTGRSLLATGATSFFVLACEWLLGSLPGTQVSSELPRSAAAGLPTCRSLPTWTHATATPRHVSWLSSFLLYNASVCSCWTGGRATR